MRMGHHTLIITGLCGEGQSLLERNVYDFYKLYCEDRFYVGDYEGFTANDQPYLLMPKEECICEESDMVRFSTYMYQAGDPSVLTLHPTRTEQLSALVDGQDVYLFPLPNVDGGGWRGTKIQSVADLGRELRGWHLRGQQGASHFQDLAVNDWPALWEKRLEQLEEWYVTVFSRGPQTEIDELFLYTYPYFMGLAENAIQFAVDAQLDLYRSPLDAGTISHYRFNDRTWLYMSERGDVIKPPTSFLFDHPARDLAEWIRSTRKDDPQSYTVAPIFTFLNGYEEQQPLTPFTWHLLYARLLFPLHYFEIIEDYYRAQVPEERGGIAEDFKVLLDTEKGNEQLLAELAEEARVKQRSTLPKLDWLPRR